MTRYRKRPGFTLIDPTTRAELAGQDEPGFYLTPEHPAFHINAGKLEPDGGVVGEQPPIAPSPPPEIAGDPGFDDEEGSDD